MIINRNKQCELDALMKDEPCRKELACDFLSIQDEYFDNTPFKQLVKKQPTSTPDYILQARQDLIKFGFINETKQV